VLFTSVAQLATFYFQVKLQFAGYYGQAA